MIPAALDDSVRKLRTGLRKERLKRKMVQDKLNEVVESLNSVTKFLDGWSVNRQMKNALIKDTFIGKKLDFLELDFLDERRVRPDA